jgi:hypothetical protein
MVPIPSNLLHVFVKACQDTLFGVLGRRRQPLLFSITSDDIWIWKQISKYYYPTSRRLTVSDNAINFPR